MKILGAVAHDNGEDGPRSTKSLQFFIEDKRPIIAGASAELVLKTTAPRTQPHLLMRERLGSNTPYLRDCPVVMIQAPAGYGKTSLLQQWRREQLACGVAVIWFSADERDNAQRFLLGLVQAVRSSCARPLFGSSQTSNGVPPYHNLEFAAAWLAEVLQLPGEVLLIVDEAERLPPPGKEALAYILHNVPQNLRVMVAARLGLEGAIDDLLPYGQAVVVGPNMLRLQFDEAIALIGKRFGPRIDSDACARLFQLTDGWPLGLQIAIAAMARTANPLQVIDAMSSNTGGVRDHLVNTLLVGRSDEDQNFLLRISIVETLHPELCEALTGDATAHERLARLMRETPMFVTSEGSAWCRLHALVREVLMVRASRLSDEALRQLNERAAAWLIDHDRLEEAARHAYAAGQLQTAYDLVDRCLHDAVKQGRLQAVLDWLDLLPEAELGRRPQLRLAAAWALALGERHQEAEQQVAYIQAGAEVARELRYECALILSSAAVYSDEIDRFVEIFSPWAEQFPDSTSWLAQAHSNRLAARALLLGAPSQARRHLQRASRNEVGPVVGYLARWGEHMMALSYLSEGQMHLAGKVLIPALASAEADLGRRHPVTCMFAAMTAMHAYASNHAEEAAALLANRLDVLERGGTPETLMIAYQTAARVAMVHGQTHRAIDVLETLYTIGLAHRLPRLCVVSIAEQIQIHSGRYRSETCEKLMRRLCDVIDQEATRHGPLWHRAVALPAALSRAYKAMTVQDWPSTLTALAEASELADAMAFGHYRVKIMALRALALERNSGNGRQLLLEALNLAQASGLTRTLVDAHPALADWIEQVAQERTPAGHAIYAEHTPSVMRPADTHSSSRLRAVPSMVLTPKEREILELLAHNFSNKEIAAAAAIGEGTVKWHLKNLFGKLDASSRKHVVRRALVLGLLERAPVTTC